MVGDNWGAITFVEPLGLEDVEKTIDTICEYASSIVPSSPVIVG